MPTLLLDSYSLLFRAFYALPPMTTRAGLPTQALYGFSSLLLKLLREERPETVAFARDLPQKTFRHESYPGYKAGRPAAPSALIEQLGMFEQLIAALDLPMFAAPGFEADDVLATLARAATARGEQALIVSGDRDLLQLVSDSVQVLFVGQRGKPHVRYDPAAVLARFGVRAEQLPSYVALIGDPADNIPKLPGIGAKGAEALIARFGSNASVLENLESIANERTRETLRAHGASLREHERLLRLRDDVPLSEPPLARPLTTRAIEQAAALFARWEFNSLLARLAALGSSLTNSR